MLSWYDVNRYRYYPAYPIQSSVITVCASSPLRRAAIIILILILTLNLAELVANDHLFYYLAFLHCLILFWYVVRIIIILFNWFVVIMTLRQRDIFSIPLYPESCSDDLKFIDENNCTLLQWSPSESFEEEVIIIILCFYVFMYLCIYVFTFVERREQNARTSFLTINN